MAFDDIKNINEEYQKNIDILINLGVNRILTKGCKYNAFEGKNNIKKYVEYAKNRIIIMPGKGITRFLKHWQPQLTTKRCPILR